MSSLWFSPERFHYFAKLYYPKRWQLLLWSFLSFTLFALLEGQIVNTTPSILLAIALFILFFALQSLVFASFLSFFKALPSHQYTQEKQSVSYRFYRFIEWAETLLFGFLLPLPTLGFIYASLMLLTSE